MMEVDQAAAVVLAGSRLADRLGVPASGRVYLRGWAYAAGPASDYVLHSTATMAGLLRAHSENLMADAESRELVGERCG
ncbi:hypothetical protein ABZ897_39640 [Nonomuraea sp. NPDC046802]|uniref:hypothetical protein n=1 Tax=Nonomuraea sp. NPDC046802 TaxID=3154919 RepID=UPI0033F10B52